MQRRKTPSESNALSKQKLLFLVVLLIAGFIYFLTQLSSQSVPEAKEVIPQKQPTVTLSKPQVNENEIPPIPEEKWSYIQALENKNVQVEVNEQEVSARPYLMQCGAWRSENYAEERKANIAFQGLESQIRVSLVKDVYWYRVVLGPYDLKRKAESDRNLLRKAGIEPCKIWFWED